MKYHGNHKYTNKKPQNQKKSINDIDYDTTDEMGDLLIPAFLQHCYLHGDPPIKTLRQWQHELLSKREWDDRKNCVAVVPTSGGKTLIAEVAIAQLLEEEPYSKALYTLPFVALAAEKANDFENKFKNFNVRPFFQNIGGSDFYNGSIGICTYEKAHSILNAAIKAKYENKIKLVVIDEVHMISDESRGVVLESLIMKLMSIIHPPQIIMLTATLNKEDAENLSMKIDGYTFFSTERNVELKKYISSQDGSLYRVKADGNLIKISQEKSIKDDHDFLLPMVRKNLNKSQNASILIFVNTRNLTTKIAKFLYENIDKDIDTVPKLPEMKQSILKLREELYHELVKSPAGLDKELGKYIMKGIGYHHAGLLLEERKIIEKGIRNGSLMIVVATTTLSAGVNIRSVSRVIIHSPYRRFNGRKIILPESLFAQMAGRSGRVDGSHGDVVIISRSNAELREISVHITKTLPSIVTFISKNEQIDTYILQCITLGLAIDFFSVKHFLKSSFKETDDALIQNSIERLKEKGLINDKYVSSKLGIAISSSNLSIDEGMTLNTVTEKLMGSLCLVDDLHLVYLCTPSCSNNDAVNIPSFKEPIWEKIFQSHENVISLITGYTSADLKKIIIQSYGGYGISKEEEQLFTKIYEACILFDIVDETPIDMIEKKYGIDRGTIQALQASSASLAGQARKFCEEMGYHPLAAAIQQFSRRLGFGVRSDIVDLMTIPSMRRDIARILFDKGYQTILDIASIDPRELSAIFSEKQNELRESDVIELSNSVIHEASILAEQMSILEELEEEATWKKAMISESDSDEYAFSY